MSDHSAIQWTDATWNPTRGCTKVSPGCAHCYIERTPPFRIAGNKFVNGKTDLEIFHDRVEQPLHWRKPRRVFVNSLSDLFHEDISDAFIDRVFAVMALTPQHTYQVLTKRAVRMRDYMNRTERRVYVSSQASRIDGDPAPDMVVRFWPLLNVWLGVSVENQHFADERIPLLLETPAAVRFISAEPLLGPVDLDRHLWRDLALSEIPAHALDDGCSSGVARRRPGLDWVIVGGESGPGARPFDVAWARSIVQQCQAAGVAVFVKQLGADPYEEVIRYGIGPWGPAKEDVDEVRLQLRDKKGGDPDEWPADLRVREFPAAAPALQPQAATPGSA